MNNNAMTISDLEKIRTLQPDSWSDITIEFEFYISSNYCNPIKIEVDNQIVGIGASISFRDSAWLAHIIVSENHRNKGIGYKLVEKLINDLKNNHDIKSYMLIATEIGKPVYSKFGFKDVCPYIFMKRDKPWIEKPSSLKINLFQESYRNSIYSLDQLISGEDRSVLISEYLPKSFVYIDNNEILGYYIPNLREGLINAVTSEAGIELMKFKYARSDKAVIPSLNIKGIEFLKENGFIETPTKGTRMVLGKNLNWKPEMIFSRIAGNFG